MARKFQIGHFLIPLAAICQILSFLGILVMLRAGGGPIKDSLPIDPYRYVTLIDTSEYVKTVEGKTYHGLPDSHDFSKSKDFFAIYPSLYCSGMKKDGKYLADYCSPWGKEFFDLHRLWRVWGVDLIEDNLIGQTPRRVFITLMIAGCADLLAIVLGLIALCSYWAAVLTVFVAWVAATSTIVTAGFSHAFISHLVRNSPKLKLIGSGKIVSYWGNPYIQMVWAAAGISLFAAVLWSFITSRKHRTRSKADVVNRGTAEQVPFGYILRRATGGFFDGKGITSYKHLGAGEEMTSLKSHNGSHADYVTKIKSLSRDHSRERSRSRSRSRVGSDNGEVSYERGRITETGTAYEPMRHQ